MDTVAEIKTENSRKIWILDDQTILYLNITIKSVCVIVCKSGLQGAKPEHVLLYRSVDVSYSLSDLVLVTQCSMPQDLLSCILIEVDHSEPQFWRDLSVIQFAYHYGMAEHIKCLLLV